MSARYIKKFEWKREGQLLFRIESVNSYLNAEISLSEYLVSEGSVHVIFVESSDMQWDDEQDELLLLDNTDYWVTYDDCVFDTVVMNELLKNAIAGRGIFNSKNYIGQVDIGISAYTIVVKSKKINYDMDFAFLRKNISDFYSDLLSRSSSYFAEHFGKSDTMQGDKINYSEIAYLKDILAPNKLPAWIDFFLMRAEHAYEKKIGNCPLSEVEEIDIDFYINGLLSGNLFKTDRIVGKAGVVQKAPYEINNYEYEMTYDTNENRFVKFYVFLIRDFISELLQVVDIRNVKLYHELEKMQMVLNERIENPFWSQISNMERIPFDSQILQKKYPYNLIFQSYSELGLISDINLGATDRKYAVGQKDVPMLYQYWVFVTLFQYLSKKYEDKYITSDWITYDGRNLNFSLVEGRQSLACFFVDEETTLHLFYNKTYDNHHSVWSGRSYSHELKPDISLEMFKGEDLIAIIHFDAKYRLPINGTDVPDDINKMHAYKDGIMGTIGAYAICLGEEKIIYHEEEMGLDRESLFPSVGSCPLNLNPDRIEQEMNGILHIVDEFTKINVTQDSNRFSKRHLMSYYALMRKMMRIEE